MPELPEMETYRRMLQERMGGQAITAIHVERLKTINVPPEEFGRILQANQVNEVKRRAKHLLFRLKTGHVLLLHLMLGGFLYWGTEQDRLNRTAQVTLSFGRHLLYFHGLRLGYLHLLTEKEADERLSDLGPEPLAPAFTADHFAGLCQTKRGVLKTALVDQHWLAGIGNCYSDELCHHAQILPTRKLAGLTPEEITRLYHSMHAILREAIQYGGYMETPLFDGDRLTGGYNNRCRVYDRGGEPCPRCGHAIVQGELSSRKVFFCPHCQT